METYGYTFGYPRISTFRQNLDRQYKLFEDLGIPENNYKPYKDEISVYKDYTRPGLTKLKTEVERGDTIYIYDFTRLGRSLKVLKYEIEWFKRKGVKIISHKENLTLTELNEESMDLWCGFIESESKNLFERLELGRIDNNKMGGKPKIKDKDIERVRKLVSKGNTIKNSCDMVGISESSYYRNR